MVERTEQSPSTEIKAKAAWHHTGEETDSVIRTNKFPSAWDTVGTMGTTHTVNTRHATR